MTSAIVRGAEANTSRAEVLAERIEKHLLDSCPAVGERLGLRTELMERFDATPSVMSGALQVLRERGLIVVRRGANGGIFVNEIPPQLRIGIIDIWVQGLASAEDLFQAKHSLEDLLCETALKRATPEDLQNVSWALDEMRANREDAQEYFRAVQRFHVEIARAARIPYVSDLYATIVALLTNSVVRARYIKVADQSISDSIGVHGEILHALRTHDMKRLVRACEAHSQQELRESHL